jgi:hypothetical protein
MAFLEAEESLFDAKLISIPESLEAIIENMMWLLYDILDDLHYGIPIDITQPLVFHRSNFIFFGLQK